jgi:hypothetical protein
VNTLGADAYYSNIGSPLALTSLALYVTQTAIADGVVVSSAIWRLFSSSGSSRSGDVMCFTTEAS